MLLPQVAFDAPPYRFSGVVYGVLHNDRAALAALGAAVDAAPYKGAPKAPVLYVKPRNTLAGPGAAVVVPEEAEALEIGAGVGLVIGRTACRVREDDALSHVAGCVIVADVSVAHDSWYRPQVRLKARDGFCPIGPRVVPLSELGDPGRLALRVHVDGARVQDAPRVDWLRPPARLLADVTDFMTLAPGDVLVAGVPHGAPRVRAGQGWAIEIEGLGRLEGRCVAAAEAAAERAP
jgi:5-oxopent-3-ene-1,2,5-tricarboxylate decarboxylase/2-hydroxyhepta-2,4-diene-1,7-dioate isomerase